MPFWLPDGTVLLERIEAEVRAQLRKRGYEEIRTPHVLDEELWHRSGHYDNYRENMFFAEPAERQRGDERRYALKPMNCPGACLVYASDRHSYRDLPLRLAEFGQVSRFEREGVLHGLLRVRAFVQDDAHVFCTPRADDRRDRRHLPRDRRALLAVRLRGRARRALDAAREVDRDRRAVGAGGGARCARRSRARAATTTRAPAREPSTARRSTSTSPTALGRSWQCGTCQLDFQMPERFELSYQGADNADHRPVMIHRALLGSMERFVGVLIEHYGGRFPLWLAPLQAVVLPVADRNVEYARGGLRRSCARPGSDRGSTSDPSRSARRSATPSSRARPTCSSSATASNPPARSRFAPIHEGDLGSVPVDEFVRTTAEQIGSRSDA